MSLSPAAVDRRHVAGSGGWHPQIMDRSVERDARAGTGARQVLFVQGGGTGTHDEWDNVLVDGLRTDLGPGHEVRYPRMPEEGDPSYPRWSAAIWREMADLDEEAAVVGHSVGGTTLVQALTQRPPGRRLAAIVLIAAPFVGQGGWPGDDFEFSGDLSERLPAGVPGARVPRGPGRDGPTHPRRVLRRCDPPGAGARALRTRPPVERRPQRGSSCDPWAFDAGRDPQLSHATIEGPRIPPSGQRHERAPLACWNVVVTVRRVDDVDAQLSMQLIGEF